MSGLKNTLKRGFSFAQGQGYTTKDERLAQRKAKSQARLDKTFQSALMPDEEEIAREERRKAAKRRERTQEDEIGLNMFRRRQN